MRGVVNEYEARKRMALALERIADALERANELNPLAAIEAAMAGEALSPADIAARYGAPITKDSLDWSEWQTAPEAGRSLLPPSEQWRVR